jgi:hypothetical protein
MLETRVDASSPGFRDQLFVIVLPPQQGFDQDHTGRVIPAWLRLLAARKFAASLHKMTFETQG